MGKCFLDHADSMRTAYTQYCLNHDKAEQLLEKFDALPEMQKVSFYIMRVLIRFLSLIHFQLVKLSKMTLQVLQQGVESLRAEISCFNMGSILIKPVQRILKYPLILNELLKCTEEEDEDKKDLREAVALMSDVAAFINETKRKKDIVEKYKTEEETTLSRKISKINMHSIGKKSSRMSQKLLTSLGMDSMVILRQKEYKSQ